MDRMTKAIAYASAKVVDNNGRPCYSVTRFWVRHRHRVYASPTTNERKPV